MAGGGAGGMDASQGAGQTGLMAAPTGASQSQSYSPYGAGTNGTMQGAIYQPPQQYGPYGNLNALGNAAGRRDFAMQQQQQQVPAYQNPYSGMMGGFNPYGGMGGYGGGYGSPFGGMMGGRQVRGGFDSTYMDSKPMPQFAQTEVQAPPPGVGLQRAMSGGNFDPRSGYSGPDVQVQQPPVSSLPAAAGFAGSDGKQVQAQQIQQAQRGRMPYQRRFMDAMMGGAPRDPRGIMGLYSQVGFDPSGGLNTPDWRAQQIPPWIDPSKAIIG